MNLLTLGDSFTFGEELVNPSADAWPQQLANKIDYSLINLGLPSNSNPAICRQLVDHLSHKHNETPDLVVIGWASPGRMEFSDIAGNFNVWPGYSGNLFKQHQPWREELLNYINRYHNDEYLFETFLNHVVFTQNLLKSQGIPYLMLNVVGNEYYKNNFLSKFKYREHLIDTELFIGWQTNEGMAEWTLGCKRGPNGHFLEEGHQRVADKIYEHIGNLGRLP